MLKTVGFPTTRTGDQTIVGGNLVIGTAGNGIDFSADPQAPGMTSELFDDYEEGTWTPTDASGAGLTFTNPVGRYVKIGRFVFVAGSLQYPATASGAEAILGGLPFNSTDFGGGATTYCDGAFQLFIRSYGGAVMGMVKNNNSVASNAQLSGAFVAFTYSYQV